MVRFKSIAFAVIAAIALGLHPGAASAQTSGLGGDGYTRTMWIGTDGSISLWKLDAALSFVGSHNYGPYPGWRPVALMTTPNNTSYVLWNYTDDTATIWVVDANLNFVTSRNFGPIVDWTAFALGLDINGNLRLSWKSTVGQLSQWTFDASLNVIAYSPIYGPYFGWIN
jgi:hypothetical protein